jgi:very-short-patch-repair endonuclease
MSIARARQFRKQMPPAEAALWNALRQLRAHGLHFRRQVPLGRYYADFACHHPRLVVEVDGQTHIDVEYDAARDAFMQGQGYRVLRVTNEDVRFNVSGVVARILEMAGGEGRSESPPTQLR